MSGAMAITRRGFLQGAGAGAALGLAAGAGAGRASAMEPIQRKGSGVMKLSLAAYSLRDYLTAPPGSKGAIDLAGFVDYCAAQGLQGTELTSYYFPKSFDREYLFGIRRQAFRLGLDVSGGAIGNDYCQPPGPKLDLDLEKTQQWIDHYADLGAPVIRVFAGSVAKGDTEKQAIDRCVKTLEVACALAGKRGVTLALENHGGITAYADTMLQIVKGVQSPWFGVNLDTGNFRMDDDPYVALAKLAPYAVNVQVKLTLGRKSKPEPADLARVVGLLRDAGYSGWVVLEYEEPDDPYSAIPRHLDTLRSLLRA